MTERNRTAIVFGKGRVAIRATELLLRESYDVRFVVPSSVELSNDASFTDWALEGNLAVRRAVTLDELNLTQTDLGISTYYDRIFRPRHIQQFRMLLNVHNSLLPKYRGVRPINWALKNGETQHGVSLHEITAGIDEGPILAQNAFSISPASDEVRDVYWRCLSTAEALLDESLPGIWDLRPFPQDDKNATYYSTADDEQLGDRRYWTRGDIRLD